MNRNDGADGPYWAGLEQGRLMLPRCEGCDRWTWPAGHRCGRCGTLGVRWHEREMKASVFSWTRTWHRFGLTEDLDLPFTTVLAEVDGCGVRLLGRLDDPHRSKVEIGAKLVGEPGITQVGDDRIPTIVWRRAA